MIKGTVHSPMLQDERIVSFLRSINQKGVFTRYEESLGYAFKFTYKNVAHSVPVSMSFEEFIESFAKAYYIDGFEDAMVEVELEMKSVLYDPIGNAKTRWSER